MTTVTPLPGTNPGLPTIDDIHFKALMLAELFEALNALKFLLGPKAGPIDAIVSLGLPYARDVARDLEALK